MRRVNLLRAHGSPTDNLYSNCGCRCAPCRAGHAYAGRRWRSAHPNESRATSARWHVANPDKVQAMNMRTRLRRHGITRERIEEMASLQRNACAICGTTEPGGNHNQWHIDHCHTTGNVRGLLCRKCNVGLGLFEDDQGRLIAAAAYLAASA